MLAANELGKSIGDAAVLASKIKKEVHPILTEGQVAKLKAFSEDNHKALDAFFKKMLEE